MPFGRRMTTTLAQALLLAYATRPACVYSLLPSIDTLVVADQLPSVGPGWSTMFFALTVPPVMSPACALICSLPSATE